MAKKQKKLKNLGILLTMITILALFSRGLASI